MKTYLFGFTALLALSLLLFSWSPFQQKEKEENESRQLSEPYEHFIQQRMYPDTVFDNAAYKNALLQIKANMNPSSRSANFNALWTEQGPGNIGGRINCVAVHPVNHNIILVGNAAGGIFKTTDGGQNWHPVFDDQSFLALSCIVFDPQHPDTLYAGTGDRNMVRYTFNGNGVYRSTDGGEHWLSAGLQQQGVISKIVVNPQNTNELYAAAMGSPFKRDSLRGVYKSLDGGMNWQRVLVASDEAGCTDLLINPQNPQTLYAASWNSIRSNTENVNSGLQSQLWKTTDGGATWSILNTPFKQQLNGRISLDISSQDPNKMYACVVDTSKGLKGIYISANGGSTWVTLDVFNIQDQLYGSNGYYFGWYFGLIKVNPWNDQDVFVGGIQLYKTSVFTPQSLFWEQADPTWWTYEVHADKHDLAFIDSSTFLLATDGGLYKTTDLGLSYTDVENIPNTQFYRVTANPHDTMFYYGGAQDNGSSRGNSDNFINWQRIFGGDGFRMIFHPTNPNIYFCETQWGAIVYTDDGGVNFYDLTSGFDLSDRFNWDFPYIMNASDPKRMYAGTNYVYKMTNAPTDFWQKVSADLTDGNVLGNASGQSFNVITSLDNAKKDDRLIYVGTSDGNVWRSDNDCATWVNISAGLPDRYVTSVKASPNDSNTVFVSHSGYRSDELIPHVHKSLNRGSTWIDISGNLPQVAINDLLILPGNDSVIFAASDGGVFVTLDGGNDWQRLGINMPLVPVFELCFNAPMRQLVAGTYGRSILTYPLDSLGVQIVKDTTTQDTTVIAIQNLNAAESVSLFPNPAINTLTISSASSFTSAELFNMEGEKVAVYQLSKPTENINISALKQGAYIVRLQNGKKSVCKKIVKAN
ncbi:MAG: T9SS type A sorting domain-containing protein [Chitinophagales bacterium]